MCRNITITATNRNIFIFIITFCLGFCLLCLFWSQMYFGACERALCVSASCVNVIQAINQLYTCRRCLTCSWPRSGGISWPWWSEWILPTRTCERGVFCNFQCDFQVLLIEEESVNHVCLIIFSRHVPARRDDWPSALEAQRFLEHRQMWAGERKALPKTTEWKTSAAPLQAVIVASFQTSCCVGLWFLGIPHGSEFHSM